MVRRGDGIALFPRDPLAARMAQSGIETLAQLPFSPSLAFASDAGRPAADGDPGGDDARRFAALAGRMVAAFAREQAAAMSGELAESLATGDQRALCVGDGGVVLERAPVSGAALPAFEAGAAPIGRASPWRSAGESSTDRGLWSIWGHEDRVVAVGDEGAIVIFDGGRWRGLGGRRRRCGARAYCVAGSVGNSFTTRGVAAASPSSTGPVRCRNRGPD